MGDNFSFSNDWTKVETRARLTLWTANIDSQIPLKTVMKARYTT